MPLQGGQHIAAVAKTIGIVRRQFEGAVETGQCLLVPIELRKRVAPLVEEVRIVRLERQRMVEALERFFVSLQKDQAPRRGLSRWIDRPG